MMIILLAAAVGALIGLVGFKVPMSIAASIILLVGCAWLGVELLAIACALVALQVAYIAFAAVHLSWRTGKGWRSLLDGRVSRD